MGNLLLIIAIVLIFLIIIGLNFESVYNHFAWTLPLTKIKSSSIYHNDNHLVNYSGNRIWITKTASIVEYIDKDTLKLNFTHEGLGFYSKESHILSKFNFTKILNKKDSFIGWCLGPGPDGLHYAHIFRIYEMYDDFAIANHYQAPLPPELVPCKLPDIIKHSIDFDFKFPQSPNEGYIPR